MGELIEEFNLVHQRNNPFKLTKKGTSNTYEAYKIKIQHLKPRVTKAGCFFQRIYNKELAVKKLEKKVDYEKLEEGINNYLNNKNLQNNGWIVTNDEGDAIYICLRDKIEFKLKHVKTSRLNNDVGNKVEIYIPQRERNDRLIGSYFEKKGENKKKIRKSC